MSGFIAIKIWAKAIIINAMLVSFYMLFMIGVRALIAPFILLLGGFIIASPLLLLIIPLVKIAVRLPYAVSASRAWLSCMLAMLAVLVYVAIALLLGEKISTDNRDLALLSSAIVVSVIIATQSTRRSLEKLQAKIMEQKANREL